MKSGSRLFCQMRSTDFTWRCLNFEVPERCAPEEETRKVGGLGLEPENGVEVVSWSPQCSVVAEAVMEKEDLIKDENRPKGRPGRNTWGKNSEDFRGQRRCTLRIRRSVYLLTVRWHEN